MQCNSNPPLLGNSVALLLNPDETAITYSNGESKPVSDTRDVSGNSTIYENSFEAEPATQSPAPKLEFLEQADNGYSKIADTKKSIDKHTTSAQSSQSANPYLYIQHRTRPNAPFDPLQVHNEKVNNNSRVVSEGTICGIRYTVQEGSIPTISVDGNADDFPTPFELYRIMEPLGKQFGAVKIDFSHCENSPFKSFNLDTENFWFKPRKQHTNSYNTELQKRLKLHHDLYSFHKGKKDSKGNPTLGKIPSIDKRTLDLHRLRSCVQLRGGFDTVCQKKLWAQIGRELGYSGRIMSSLSTSLRSAYLKVFSEFDSYEKQQKLTTNIQLGPTPLDQKSFYGHIKRSSEEVDEASIASHQVGPPTKIPRIEEQYNNEFGGSGKEYFRMRDVLDAKGFSTRFGSVTETKTGLTTPNELTLPDYNFSLWNKHVEVYDKSLYEWKNSPIYNLRQYHEKAQRHREIVHSTIKESFPELSYTGNELSLDDFEKLYRTIVKEKTLSFDVDTGIDLPTTTHGSSFSSSKKTRSTETKRDAQNWNLNTINFSGKSLLQYQDLDYGNLTCSKIDVGMMLSTSGWALEDEFLPSLDLSLLGSSKVWYFVPPQHRASLEELFTNARKRTTQISADQFETDFTESDFFQSFHETNFLDQHKTSRTRTNNHVLLQNIFQREKRFYTPNDFQPSASELLASNIRCFRAVQEPNTFIMKFPQVYSTSINSGFQISEKSLFAPKEWVNHIADAESWRAENQRLPCILPFQLFVNIAENSDDNDLLNIVSPLLLSLIQDELKGRALIPNDMTRVPNKFDPISDVDLSPCGASKIVIANDSDCVSVSIKQYLELRPMLSDFKNLKIELHEYYPDSYLSDLASKVGGKKLHDQVPAVGNPESSLLECVQSLISERQSDSKVPFSELNKLLSKYHHEESEEYRLLRELVNECQIIISDCQSLLERTQVINFVKREHDFSFAMTAIDVPNYDVTFEELSLAYRKVTESSIKFNATDSIGRLMTKFIEFQRRAQKYLESDDLGLLESVYSAGVSLGINSIYLKIYADKITKIQWLTVYNDVFVSKEKRGSENSNAAGYSLTHMHSYLLLGIELFGDLRIDELETVANELRTVQLVMKLLQKLLTDKTHRMNATDLEELVEKAQSLCIPWGNSLKEILTSIGKTITNSRSILLPMQEKLSVNASHILPFESLIKSGKVSDSSSVLQKFDGSKKDKRLTQTEALESLEHPLYSKHMKATKTWQQDFNKVFTTGKAGLTALINSAKQCYDPTDLPASAEESTRYCFCRRGDNGNVMVQCEICTEWYHTSCINDGKWILPEDDGTVFCCQLCLHPVTNHSKYTTTFDQIQSLLIQSAKLTIVPDKTSISELFELYKLCATFSSDTREKISSLQAGNTESDAAVQAQVSQVKFYLRKIIGAGIAMPDLTTRMADFCKTSDTAKANRILDSSVKIISGLP
ncbi:unnamed protein product [Kluyveromyces dobzhanskii CBS 2104]|uniref:WGS project CCBQ000000000 data, contig 00043 n=1 Tax=Kluyveromyces dobzhanskii CBS 2104 TaxID=1427455 RepID=A0A0A8L591_9SACH|nr:unnamed protein product [Kluyveromyces dobzhanskii CBS 2104]